MKAIALGCIRFYAYAISPLFGASCRYKPTCSQYAKQAIEQHGLLRGLKLALIRIVGCGPGGGSGNDPVPEASPSRPAENQDR